MWQSSIENRESLDVTISLVSYNQRTDLERLLPSLLIAAAHVQSELLLVDCNSNDGTVRSVRKQFPEVNILINSKRAGYGENHNINLGRTKGRYFVIMNSDMTVEPDVFVVLRDYMDHHSDVGIITPKILHPDGTVQGLNKRYPTIYDLFLRCFLPKICRQFFKRRLAYYEMRDIGYDHIYDVPFLSGSFMFCRTGLLRKVEGFDPGFFLYFEDVDLCRRVQRTHRTVYNPNSSVTHFWKREAHVSCLFTYYFIRSAFRYFNRWGYKVI